MDEKISVIIPVHNSEKTLRKCVESLVYGEYKKLDIILIDDCSKDGSWNLCQSLSEENDCVRCYQNDKNRGVSYTRNHGLDEVKGEYILFVDSDDWVSGKYARHLYDTTVRYNDELTICGLHFIDYVNDFRTDYLWNNGKDKINVIERIDFFKLPSAFLLQQLWNKIFVKKVIYDHKIRFDETQTMGEDYQFVLEYMKAIECKQCVVINEPLYYYIRANNTSLMSKFGLVDNENEYKRIDMLKELCNSDSAFVNNAYKHAIENTKNNYVYYCVHNKQMTKNEKLNFIEKIMQDGKSKEHYSRNIKIKAKEDLVSSISIGKKLVRRVINKLHRLKIENNVKRIRNSLKDCGVSLISQNCISGVFYHDMGQRFLSPTINLYFNCADFVKFVLNLDHYLKLKPEMHWEEEYPVGYLDDIRINFMHYDSCSEAYEKWEQRKERIDFNRTVIICTDMENFTDEVYQQWKLIKFPKLLFTANKNFTDSSVFYPKYVGNGAVDDLIPNRAFYKDNKLIEVVSKVGNEI